MARWSNWSATVDASGIEMIRPVDREELMTSAAHLFHQGRRVRPLGNGHSFSAVGEPNDTAVDLSLLDSVVSVDRRRSQVTVEAGMSLRRLNTVLDAHGLALENMGDIDRQTVSGALSTGTHGTGASFGGLATQVRGVELLTPDGDVVAVNESNDDFQGMVIALGALGIVVSVTLQCVPAFRLEAREAPMRVDELLPRLDEFADGTDHFEFYWFPNTHTTLTKRNRRLPREEFASPPGRLSYWWNESFTENILFHATNRIGSLVSPGIPRLNRAAARFVSARHYTDTSHRVFTSPRTVVFREMEYALPRHCVHDALRELMRYMDRSRTQVSFPVEVRFARADDLWLSTAHQRDTAYIAVHQYHRNPHRKFFAAAERIFGAFEGRPHWGKLHGLDATRLAELYPRFTDFRELRDRYDPQRRLTNRYLNRVLGD
ncbi:D-arabinono-1,4-lactone oxidase [Haloglycomyces albus]|uniref:D-arabinono-1,4-lactone oxidase n=1 Tax=Haloglycomyces albus TaxID=526067 RepID=UPI00046CDEEE|nr:D-arabinono-1,4-lactone oxidase [Haloglycomyces albus]